MERTGGDEGVKQKGRSEREMERVGKIETGEEEKAQETDRETEKMRLRMKM